MRGFVYVLTNPAIPWMVKVGSTINDPQERAHVLSKATGVPLPFRVTFYGQFPDCRSAEREVHGCMSLMRVTRAREFFGLDEGWGALTEAARWIYHHPDRIGEVRFTPEFLELTELGSVEHLFNPWEAVL